MADHGYRDACFTAKELAILMGKQVRAVQALLEDELPATKWGHDYAVHPDDLAGLPVYRRGRPGPDGTNIIGRMRHLTRETRLACSCGRVVLVQELLDAKTRECPVCGLPIVTYEEPVAENEAGELVERHPDGSATVRLADGQHRLEPPGYCGES